MFITKCFSISRNNNHSGYSHSRSGPYHVSLSIKVSTEIVHRRRKKIRDFMHIFLGLREMAKQFSSKLEYFSGVLQKIPDLYLFLEFRYKRAQHGGWAQNGGQLF